MLSQRFLICSCLFVHLLGLELKTIVVKQNALKSGTKYNILLFLTLPGRSRKGEATWSLFTNTEPYDGSCSVSPSEGL